MKLKRVTFKRPLYGTTFTVEPGPGGSIELLEGLHAVRIATPEDCLLVPWSDVAHAEPCDPVQEVTAVVVGPDEMDGLIEAQAETVVATPTAKRKRK